MYGNKNVNYKPNILFFNARNTNENLWRGVVKLNWLPNYHLSVLKSFQKWNLSRIAFAEMIIFLHNAPKMLIIDENE